MPDDQQVIVEQVGDVAVFTLNRPERLNAWTTTMMRQLRTALVAANDDPTVGAVLVTGAGRGFCAGADIGGEFAPAVDGADRAEAARTEDESPAPASDWVRLCRSSKPLVAAINGPAIGIGLTLVLPFDQLIAAEGAKLSARFVKMGLVPELASSHFLVARCGFGNASWLALSGTTVLAEDAVNLGLVDLVVPPEQLLEVAMGRGHGAGRQPDDPGAPHQGAAHPQRRRDRPGRGAAARAGRPRDRLHHPGAPRGRPRLPGEAPARLPLTRNGAPHGHRAA